MSTTLKDRLAEVAQIAVRIEAETGLPAQVLIAQWAIESRWGGRPAGHANYFGMKKAARHTMTCTVDTREVICGEDVEQALEFADYPDLESSCRDYAWLITHGTPYEKAWSRFLADGDVDVLIANVSRVYATSPYYERLVNEISSQHNVLSAIERVTNGPRL